MVLHGTLHHKAHCYNKSRANEMVKGLFTSDGAIIPKAGYFQTIRISHQFCEYHVWLDISDFKHNWKHFPHVLNQAA